MNQRSQKVGVVSADPRVRLQLASILAAHGLGIDLFRSAGSYLMSAESATLPCLILDVDLPDMSGLELQKQIADSGAAVLFASQRSDIALTLRAISAGAIDFLTLPLDAAAFMRSVRAAIELGRIRRGQPVSDLRGRLGRLTSREQQVLRSVISGLLNKQVAAELGISEITVHAHRRRVMQKMGAVSFADLVRIAASLGIPPMPRLREIA